MKCVFTKTAVPFTMDTAQEVLGLSVALTSAQKPSFWIFKHFLLRSLWSISDFDLLITSVMRFKTGDQLISVPR